MNYNTLANEKVSIAHSFLDSYVQGDVTNPTVIFDIDDTLISRYGLIKPVFELYNRVKEMGMNTIIITARLKQGLSYTEKQLNDNNITGYSQLYLRDLYDINPWLYKLSARKQVYDDGFDTIMSIGDFEWDLGEYGGFGVLLPKII